MRSSNQPGCVTSRLGVTVSLAIAVWVSQIAAADNSHGKMEPPDVFVQVAVVRGELESLRFVMGRPQNEQPPIRVNGAAPREVYFQALTLFRKADRLCFEHTRDRKDEPKTPDRLLTAGDVYAMVDAALQRIRKVKEKLKIEKPISPPAREGSKRPTDVFQSIVQANRQLNLLLERRFTPSDVFQQVTRGVALTSRLLEKFPETTIADAPKFEVGKRPADVFRRLVGCFEIVRGIAKRSGEKFLEFEPDDEQIKRAEPSDVYDIASLLVSELAYLHSRVAGVRPPRKVYYPGRKFPSHVYQRAGLLERQLAELDSIVSKHPDWLKTDSKSP